MHRFASDLHFCTHPSGIKVEFRSDLFSTFAAYLLFFPCAGFGSLVRTLVELGIYPANVLILRVFLRKENSAVGDVGQNPDQPREAADFPGGERFFEI